MSFEIFQALRPIRHYFKLQLDVDDLCLNIVDSYGHFVARVATLTRSGLHLTPNLREALERADSTLLKELEFQPNGAVQLITDLDDSGN